MHNLRLKRGMTIYLAKKDDITIRKVHLENNSEVRGIYGLGVLPEYRGKGLGRALLLRAVEQLRQEHSGIIMLQVATQTQLHLICIYPVVFVKPQQWIIFQDYFELKP